MIADLNITGGYGGPLLPYHRADGVIADLAAHVKRSPWLSFEGAVCEWGSLAGDERRLTITPERWQYILHRAEGEIPDLGGAENLAELLWSDGLAAELSLPERGRFPLVAPVGRVDVTFVRRGQRWGAREHVGIERNANEVIRAYLRTIDSATHALPPELDVTSPEGTNAQRRYEGKGTLTWARCLGCDVTEQFEGAPADRLPAAHPPADWVRREMLRKHRLCGIRRAEKIEQELRRRHLETGNPYGPGTMFRP